MRIAIYGRLTATTDLANLRTFFSFLKSENIPYQVYAGYVRELIEAAPGHFSTDVFPVVFRKIEEVRDCEFLYSLGGDGTLLDAIRFAVYAGISVVGVNSGRLGFLASGSQHELLAITKGLLLGNYKVDCRTMIKVDSNPPLSFGGHSFGLNEVTVHKANSNEMIIIHTYVNGEFLNTYWCDGLIVSTPTGSTAYNLACGGPIMMPTANVFAITPIAPHSLTVRPFLLPDDAVVSFGIESRSGTALIAVDSRTELVHTKAAEIAIRKAETRAKLVKVNAPSYFSTLRTRLSWGVDIRN